MTFTVNQEIQEIQIKEGYAPPPPPPNGGCPFLFVYNSDSDKYLIDNNILHRAEVSVNPETDITDKYLLQIKPGYVNGKLSLGILEADGDVNYFDRIKLYAVDHNLNEKVAITENNDIVVFADQDVESPEMAFESGEDVTEYVQYDMNYWGEKIVHGFPSDSIEAQYGPQKRPITPRGSESIIDSLAMFAKIGQNVLDIYPNWNVKIQAGIATINTTTDSYNKSFFRREKNSPIVIPFSTTANADGVNNININWSRDYQIEYLGVVNVKYSGYSKTEIPLLAAFHSKDGDVLSSLQSVDQNYLEMDSTGYLILTFDSIFQQTATKFRQYVFVVDGHYLLPSQTLFKSPTEVDTKIDLNKNKTELFGNYPNPFNPSTNIKFKLTSFSKVILRIYDVLGKEIQTLVHDYKDAGSYSIMFDGSLLPSGVYYYKLITDESSQIRKMVLIK